MGSEAPQFHQERPEVYLGCQCMDGCGARHNGYAGRPGQCVVAVTVEERLEEPGVSRLVGGRGHDHHIALRHGREKLADPGSIDIEEVSGDGGQVNREAIVWGIDRVGDGGGDDLGDPECS